MPVWGTLLEDVNKPVKFSLSHRSNISLLTPPGWPPEIIVSLEVNKYLVSGHAE